ncbi:rod shape-determining protein MreC [Streptococcus saliviloxodontae]|uniref:Cell shape-determining protein MreC n=2 Tax=Streptococcus saliviloxodontae TaxID=1349416 RepID=A0ABS2PJW0_9STRE|nr:rod shape-determining protein MreC [Streptococcus saliviloxodontae]
MSAVAVFLLVFIILVNSSGVFTKLSSPVVSVFSRVDSAVSQPFSFLLNLNENISSLFSTYAENKELKKENTDLKSTSIESSDLEKRVQELEGILNLSSSLSMKNNITANVVSRSPVSWMDKVLLDKGSKDSIKTGMLVLNSSGLIGYIDKVSEKSSSVALLTNSSKEANISMKISSTSGEIYGILEGFDMETHTFIISQLNSANPINVGDNVVTSGLDGSTVSGISLGSVSKVVSSSDHLKSKVYVSSEVNFDNFSYVTIVGD